MSYPVLTPQRPLPGAYFQTPAPNTTSTTGPLFPTRSNSTAATTLAPTSSLVPAVLAAPQSRNETLTTRERAARTINDTLAQESRYPDLDSYLSRG